MPQQQQVRQRQKRDPLSVEDQTRLKDRLNASYSADILNIARHFGTRPLATSARVTDIDSSGITIEWQWADASTRKSATDDMQFAFRELTGPSSVLHEVSNLALEAHKALGLAHEPQLTKDKREIDAKNLVDFTFRLPSVPAMASILFGIWLLAYMALVTNVHPSLAFIRAFVSQDTCYHLLVWALIVHALEAGAVYAFCYLLKIIQPQQMNTETQAKWTLGVAMFGLACLHDFAQRVARQFAIAGR
ncbi:hypothetical protein GGI20_001407 [Coemansia sp. BCRC 34301]|nr:hypothetical protein GGI20_001407 [Coemansia sp. BCRC 34301]